jgi:hypothetical protein
MSASASGQDAGSDIVWEYDAGEAVTGLDRLPNGDVVFSGKSSGKVFQVRPEYPVGGTVEWSTASLLHGPDIVRRLPSGNTLATDTSANKVVELDGSGTIVKSFGTGTDSCSDADLSAPSDAVRATNGDTLICDQGNQRLLRLDATGAIAWQYGASPTRCSGIGPDQLSLPYGLELLADDDVLVVEVLSHRVSRITPQLPRGGTVDWEYGDGTAGAGPNQLHTPTRAHLLTNGDVLIADADNHRIIEVQPTPPQGGTIVWQYGQTGVAGAEPGQINRAYDAIRLPDGATLIADTGNNRLLRVGGLGSGQWSVTCGCSGTSGPLLLVLAVLVLLRSGRKAQAAQVQGLPVVGDAHPTPHAQC